MRIDCVHTESMDDGDGSCSAASDISSNRSYLLAKTVVEWLFAAMLLMLAAPTILLLAAAVKITSPGPAFYSQVRLGRGGRTYRIHKLRTMVENCEAKTGPVWSKPHDARVTRIGWFLRETHLDELPQFWNILCGEMALIGPRPERPELNYRLEQALPGQSDRLLLRPGMTGLAQMQDGADGSGAEVARKLAHDLHYVRSVGPLLDLRIALSTFLHLISRAAGTGAKVLVRSSGAARNAAPVPDVEGRVGDDRPAFEAAHRVAA